MSCGGIEHLSWSIEPFLDNQGATRKKVIIELIQMLTISPAVRPHLIQRTVGKKHAAFHKRSPTNVGNYI